jgi:hypothetical protein
MFTSFQALIASAFFYPGRWCDLDRRAIVEGKWNKLNEYGTKTYAPYPGLISSWCGWSRLHKAALDEAVIAHIVVRNEGPITF